MELDNLYLNRAITLRDDIVQTSIDDAKKLIKLIKKNNKEKDCIKLNEILKFYDTDRFELLLFDKNYNSDDFIEIYFNREEKQIMKDVKEKYECCKRNIKSGYVFRTKNNLYYVRIGMFGCLLKEDDNKSLYFKRVINDLQILDLYDRSGIMVATTRTTGDIIINKHYKTLYHEKIYETLFVRGCVFTALKYDKEIKYYRFGNFVKEILVTSKTNVIFDNVPDSDITAIFNYNGQLISEA